jgi:Protein of unknown function (DUF3379)
MNHNEARLLIGADPGTVPAELAEHLAGCPECTQFQREMLALDTKIRRALEQAPLAAPPAPSPVVSIGDALASTQTGAPGARPRGRARAWSGWALAASVALLSILTVWALRPNDSLAHDVVRHIQVESDSWTSDEHVTPAEVKKTLAQAGVVLDMHSDKVMYAHTCLFRGNAVPHLVVSTPEGRVTVIILRYETVKHRMNFQESGMTGVIMPAPRGSIAVLMQGNENIDAVAQQMQQSVHWLP